MDAWMWAALAAVIAIATAVFGLGVCCGLWMARNAIDEHKAAAAWVRRRQRELERDALTWSDPAQVLDRVIRDAETVRESDDYDVEGRAG